jgi:hypothetical protein
MNNHDNSHLSKKKKITGAACDHLNEISQIIQSARNLNKISQVR